MSATQKLTHERVVLGSLISYGADAYREAVDAGLSSADWTIDFHRNIWELLKKSAESQDPLDLVRTIERIIESGEPDKFGGLAYVAALPDAVPTIQVLPSYLKEVRQGSQRRGLLAVGQWLCAEASRVDLVVDDIVAEVHERTDAAALEGSSCSATSLFDLAGRVDSHLSSESDLSPPMATGIEPIDRHFLGGLKRQQMWVLAARPGVGKTAVALNLALGLARNRSGCLFASLEQPEEQIGLRLTAAATGIELGRLSRRRLSERDWGVLRGGADKASKACGELEALSALPIWVDAAPAQSIGHIRSQISRTRRAAESNGKRLDVVFVDYIQRMKRPDGESRDDSVGALARGLADLARSSDVCVIALSQLSRAIEKRQTQTPQLSDLRESGVIEEAADVVIGLRRPNSSEQVALPDDQLDLHVMKNRHGSTGLLSMAWDGPTVRILGERQVTPRLVEYV